MTIKVGAGGGLPELAVDLTWPDDSGTNGSLIAVTGVNVQGSLQTALTATGKFAFYYLRISGNTAEATTVKLTIDGVVIWNEVGFTPGTQIHLYNNDASGLVANEPNILVNETFLLEMQTATDTNITINYGLRPIA